MPKRVLFVCSGNTCRSPMAEALFRQRMGATVEAASAGLAASNGEAATEWARQVMAERGIDLSGHRSRRADHEVLLTSDLVLTMTAAQREQARRLAPEAAARIVTLGEFAGRPGEEVEDPFQGSLEQYRRTARQIEELIDAVVVRLRHDGGAQPVASPGPPASTATGVRPMATVAVGWDHAGWSLREPVVDTLKAMGWQVWEAPASAPSREVSVDYPDVAVETARAVAEGRATLGVLVCGTGIGMSITANKVPGVRAALCTDPFTARMARRHNDANVLALGARVIGPGMAEEVVRAFVESAFEGGRHGRRVEKIRNLEGPGGPAAARSGGGEAGVGA